MAYNRTLQHFTSSQELATIWASGQSYIVNQLVLNNNLIYRCLIANTSSASFATDLGAGKWVEVSASAAGTKNYISNSNFEQNTTTGWSLFNTTLTSKIPTGSITAGAASITSFAVDSTTPIAGTYDLRVASSGVLAAGQGFISDAFTIDREDQAKPLTFSFAYEAVSGTMDFSGTSNNTFAVYIYDVSGSAWIQPAGVYNLVQSSGVGIASGSFQTTATGTQYRIAVICITATSGAVEMRFDDFQLGPQKVLAGAAVSDWVSYTPTWTSAGTAPSIGNGSLTGKYRRVGDSVEIQINMESGTSTAYGSANPWFFGLPSGFSIDSSKISTVSQSVGSAYAIVSATKNAYLGTVYTGSNALIVLPEGGGVSYAWQSNTPIAWAAVTSNQRVNISATVPISGLSSNTVMSQDTDTRVVAAKYKGVPPTSITSGVLFYLDFNSADFDTHNAWTSTGAHTSVQANGSKYTVPVSGYYRVSCNLMLNETSGAFNGTNEFFDVSLTKNGSIVSTISSRPFSGQQYPSRNGTMLVNAVAGDILQLAAIQTSGTSLAIYNSADLAFIEFERLSGPATIAASESVQAKFWASGNGTTNNTTPINFDSKVYDSHGAVTTGASWKFTAPISGKYRLSTFINSSVTPASNVYIRVRTNGVSPEAFDFITTTQGASSGSHTLSLNAGDYIDITSNANFPWYGSSITNGASIISIERIGN